MRWLVAILLSILLVSFAAPAAVDEASDHEIRDTLMVKLAGDRDVRGTRIEVEVEDGVATLSGEVFNEKAKKRAEKMSKKHKGVKRVVNNLTVAP
jgi:osmotically-inducible protein OsmY